WDSDETVDFFAAHRALAASAMAFRPAALILRFLALVAVAGGSEVMTFVSIGKIILSESRNSIEIIAMMGYSDYGFSALLPHPRLNGLDIRGEDVQTSFSGRPASFRCMLHLGADGGHHRVLRSWRRTGQDLRSQLDELSARNHPFLYRRGLSDGDADIGDALCECERDSVIESVHCFDGRFRSSGAMDILDCYQSGLRHGDEWGNLSEHLPSACNAGGSVSRLQLLAGKPHYPPAQLHKPDRPIHAELPRRRHHTPGRGVHAGKVYPQWHRRDGGGSAEWGFWFRHARLYPAVDAEWDHAGQQPFG